MRKPVFVALLLLPSAAFANPVHLFDELALSRSGTIVASIEYDEPAHDGDEPTRTLVVRTVAGDRTTNIGLACPPGPACKPSAIALSPDASKLGFVLHVPGDDKSHLYEVGTDGTGLAERLAFDGTLGGLRYGKDGRLALLAVAGAHKEVGAIKAGAPLSGVIGVDEDEQRIAILDGSRLDFVSPANLFVYEFDWRPDGSGFVATAAPGNGDNAWWTAKLWSFPTTGPAEMLYAPPAKRQLAAPRVSGDGRQVAFIGGIMSDFGSTGGDAFVLPLQGSHRSPTDLTPGMKATVTGLDWNCRRDGRLTATTLAGPDAQLRALDTPTAAPKILWSGPESIGTGGWSAAVACGNATMAAVHQDFTTAPEIETASPDGAWHNLTTVNRDITLPVVAKSLTWHSDAFDVQGWLLVPTDRADNDNQRLITVVHGGPSAASTPEFLTENRGRYLLAAGYDVFLPNPRGSFGQGEAFTLANVADFGHGDLRDILKGVDAAMRTTAISPDGLGIMGYSYGGYMTMWAVTQTNRFKAAVAGAGVSDWLSYYGENGIDQWMIPFFGASVYDDPAVYAKSSPINFVRNVKTPTFEFVGDRDVECPLPQTQEFWHALHALGVPTEFVVYPGQGHEMHDAADRADAKRRTLAWFARYLAPTR